MPILVYKIQSEISKDRNFPIPMFSICPVSSGIAMFRHCVNLFYGKVPIQFVSQYSVEESVARLSAVVKPSILCAVMEQCAVGSVTQKEVCIQRVIPFIRNSWKPYFYGSFMMVGDAVILKGVFSYSKSMQVVMTLWFGFLILWILTASITALSKSPSDFLPMQFGFVMLLFGITIVSLGKCFARNDIVWLSRVITKALSGHETQNR
jgi:hypothetical protein